MSEPLVLQVGDRVIARSFCATGMLNAVRCLAWSEVREGRPWNRDIEKLSPDWQDTYEKGRLDAANVAAHFGQDGMPEWSVPWQTPPIIRHMMGVADQTIGTALP